MMFILKLQRILNIRISYIITHTMCTSVILTNIKNGFGIPDLAAIIAATCWEIYFVLTKSANGSAHEQFRIFILNIIRGERIVFIVFIQILGLVVIITCIGITKIRTHSERIKKCSHTLLTRNTNNFVTSDR